MTTSGGLNHPDRVIRHYSEQGDLMNPDRGLKHPGRVMGIALGRVI
jgi:hypothetical protein